MPLLRVAGLGVAFGCLEERVWEAEGCVQRSLTFLNKIVTGMSSIKKLHSLALTATTYLPPDIVCHMICKGKLPAVSENTL